MLLHYVLTHTRTRTRTHIDTHARTHNQTHKHTSGHTHKHACMHTHFHGKSLAQRPVFKLEKSFFQVSFIEFVHAAMFLKQFMIKSVY